ncbi:hypothetical protein [Peribacillus butanolivorans]|uniref:hypothetical protein n=1 Tax=Peribacillus butanolivorans TaxID=421767 RepID=UPI003673493A
MVAIILTIPKNMVTCDSLLIIYRPEGWTISVCSENAKFSLMELISFLEVVIVTKQFPSLTKIENTTFPHNKKKSVY